MTINWNEAVVSLSKSTYTVSLQATATELLTFFKQNIPAPAGTFTLKAGYFIDEHECSVYNQSLSALNSTCITTMRNSLQNVNIKSIINEVATDSVATKKVYCKIQVIYSEVFYSEAIICTEGTEFYLYKKDKVLHISGQNIVTDTSSDTNLKVDNKSAKSKISGLSTGNLHIVTTNPPTFLNNTSSATIKSKDKTVMSVSGCTAASYTFNYDYSVTSTFDTSDNSKDSSSSYYKLNNYNLYINLEYNESYAYTTYHYYNYYTVYHKTIDTTSNYTYYGYNYSNYTYYTRHYHPGDGDVETCTFAAGDIFVTSMKLPTVEMGYYNKAVAVESGQDTYYNTYVGVIDKWYSLDGTESKTNSKITILSGFYSYTWRASWYKDLNKGWTFKGQHEIWDEYVTHFIASVYTNARKASNGTSSSTAVPDTTRTAETVGIKMGTRYRFNRRYISGAFWQNSWTDEYRYYYTTISAKTWEPWKYYSNTKYYTYQTHSYDNPVKYTESYDYPYTYYSDYSLQHKYYYSIYTQGNRYSIIRELPLTDIGYWNANQSASKKVAKPTTTTEYTQYINTYSYVI